MLLDVRGDEEEVGDDEEDEGEEVEEENVDSVDSVLVVLEAGGAVGAEEDGRSRAEESSMGFGVRD